MANGGPLRWGDQFVRFGGALVFWGPPAFGGWFSVPRRTDPEWTDVEREQP